MFGSILSSTVKGKMSHIAEFKVLILTEWPSLIWTQSCNLDYNQFWYWWWSLGGNAEAGNNLHFSSTPVSVGLNPLIIQVVTSWYILFGSIYHVHWRRIRSPSSSLWCVEVLDCHGFHIYNLFYICYCLGDL